MSRKQKLHTYEVMCSKPVQVSPKPNEMEQNLNQLDYFVDTKLSMSDQNTEDKATYSK